ncbi:hypothetical protein [Candidatus Aalborgicola defluviihabitans]|uniref:hypothetical protein n=1 Tax=Candidatus Aalborgicola defluviihabitans TaxID=3386187 RepID=UPI001ED642B1|nr:hypothetical protein [Burkholderiales bacterium]
MILKPVMRPAMRSPMGSAMDWGRSNNPNAEAIALLRKFNASVWLFGSGNVGGLQAGNYLDSTLGTPASIDGPIGLELDAMGTGGGEVVNSTNWSNGYVTSGSKQTPIGWDEYQASHVSASTTLPNSFTFVATAHLGGIEMTTTLTVGKTYRGQIRARKLSEVSGTPSLQFYIESTWIPVIPGGAPVGVWYTTDVIIRATSTEVIISNFTGAAAWEVETCSIREVTGNHATQPTTANKPVLRVTGGKYYGEFDGINDSLLTGNLALTNTFSIVVAGNLSSLPSQQTLIGEDTGGAQVYVTSGGAIVFAKVGTGVLATTAAGEVVAGTPFVATATLAGGNAIIRKNGVQKVSTASALTLSATTGARIGGTFAGAEYCAGSLSALSVSQGAATNAELLTVEKWAASITPGGPTI